MSAARQILTIARTEFRFSLRRSAPAVATALIGLLAGAGILVPMFAALKDWSALSLLMTPEQAERWTSMGFTLEERLPFLQGTASDSVVFASQMAWILMLLAFVVLPMAASATLPADRRFGVMDWLRSTPITGSTYLGGKILGVCAVVCLTAAGVLAVFFAVAEITLLAALHFGLTWTAAWFYLELAALDGLPLLMCGTIVGILAGAFIRTRRGAIFPGLLAGLAGLYAWITAFRAPATELPIIDVVQYYLLQNYRSAAQDLMVKIFGEGILTVAEDASRVGMGQILVMYLLVFIALSILAALARLFRVLRLLE